MEITCPKCLKKFEANEALIPHEGRLVQCGSCENKWFFKKETKPKKEIIKTRKIDNDLKKFYKKQKNKKTKSINQINEDIIVKNKTYNEIKENNFNFFKYFIVIIISSIAIIVILDTFKNQISFLYPNINVILQNLYESLKDINLFLKDLIK